MQSTAFLIGSRDSYLLYLGDTGADEIEKSQNLHNLWQAVAPLIKNKQLKAIMIEVSFPDEQPDKTLFGHLTPRWLMKEMADLAGLAGNDALAGFSVVVTHVKPPQANIEKLKVQLKQGKQFKTQTHLSRTGKSDGIVVSKFIFQSLSSAITRLPPLLPYRRALWRQRFV